MLEGAIESEELSEYPIRTRNVDTDCGAKGEMCDLGFGLVVGVGGDA